MTTFNRYDDHIRAMRRELDRNGWISATVEPEFELAHPLPVPFLENHAEQKRCWLYESVWVALTHPETRIAFRCYIQAVRYAAETGEKSPALCDALRAAEDRIESLPCLSRDSRFAP